LKKIPPIPVTFSIPTSPADECVNASDRTEDTAQTGRKKPVSRADPAHFRTLALSHQRNSARRAHRLGGRCCIGVMMAIL
jgi:hypothetical protein